MKVAILGAGHGGVAMAGDLTLAGHEIRLAAVPEHSGNLKLLQAFGGIMVEGVTSSGAPVGFARPAMMTTDVAAAIRGCEARGARMIDRAPRPGAHGARVAFVDPGSSGSVVTELLEYPHPGAGRSP